MTVIMPYLAGLAAMIVLDTIALSQAIRPLFEREMPGMLGETPVWAAAVLFYLIYPAGVVYFAALPAVADGGGWRVAARDGALLGLLAYATFELTSMAVIRGWTWTVVVADMAWGTVLTAAVAVAAHAAAGSVR